MRSKVAVIDSTSLICFTHLGLAPYLAHLFDTIYVPREVQKEVNKKHRSRYKVRRIFLQRPFEKCTIGDPWGAMRLLAEIGAGEAEALAQAQENGARYLVSDDEKARKIGHNMGFLPLGTVRLLARLHLEGHCDPMPTLVKRLRKELGFRVTDQIVERALQDAAEPI